MCHASQLHFSFTAAAAVVAVCDKVQVCLICVFREQECSHVDTAPLLTL